VNVVAMSVDPSNIRDIPKSPKVNCNFTIQISARLCISSYRP